MAFTNIARIFLRYYTTNLTVWKAGIADGEQKICNFESREEVSLRGVADGFCRAVWQELNFAKSIPVSGDASLFGESFFRQMIASCWGDFELESRRLRFQGSV
ncbi:hypothetical protein HDF10_000423 [Edaphobacter lichenicola]|uniref:Uncharacterized protein n=1 Tax=Tunturiibacter lichenicola TaxID=2051959 RepID=A0A7W8J4I1_9BACT|nr:hypothetical protein [Edaphobacter lichenicola]